MPDDVETNDEGIPKLSKGKQLQLQTKIEPENTTYKDIEWSVSDETIATIDENGTINVLSNGTIVITAYIKIMYILIQWVRDYTFKHM